MDWMNYWFDYLKETPIHALSKTILAIYDQSKHVIQIRSQFRQEEVWELKLSKDMDQLSDICFEEPEAIPNLCVISKSGKLQVYNINLNLSSIVSYELIFEDLSSNVQNGNWKIISGGRDQVLFHSEQHVTILTKGL